MAILKIQKLNSIKNYQPIKENNEKITGELNSYLK